jgi:signal transduction histidine kinase
MRRLRATSPLLADALLAAALLALGLYETFTTSVDGSQALRAAAIGLVTLPVALRRRAPLAAAVVSSSGLLLEGVSMDAMNSLAELLAGLVLVYSVPRHLPLERAVLAIPAFVVGIGAHRLASPGSGLADLLFDIAFVTGAWALGSAARARVLRNAELEERAERLEHERTVAAERAAAEERLRIAGELHDIVAHALGVVAVQAGAAEQVLASDPDRARETLTEIRSTVREAVVEMRRLLGVLRAAEGDGLTPQPSLAQLGQLVERVRRTGLEVDLVVEGAARALAPGVEVSAYRIVQEALTNVVRHAGASRATVAVRYLPDAIDVEVRDDGRGANGDGAGQAGHGLVGVRERVALHGGTLAVGPLASGGFEVRASLPLGPVAA